MSYTLDNTDGFTAQQLDVLNEAHRQLVKNGYLPTEANDLLTNSWYADDSHNTVEELVKRASK